MSEKIESWHTMEELTKYLQVSRESVLEWIAERGLPAHKLGRLWRFKYSEIDEWIRSGGASGEPTPNEDDSQQHL